VIRLLIKVAAFAAVVDDHGTELVGVVVVQRALRIRVVEGKTSSASLGRARAPSPMRSSRGTVYQVGTVHQPWSVASSRVDAHCSCALLPGDISDSAVTTLTADRPMTRCEPPKASQQALLNAPGSEAR
jgi:hypothetical protein